MSKRLIAFEINSELDEKINKMADFLDLECLPAKNRGNRSTMIRLAIEDVYNIFYDQKLVNYLNNEIYKKEDIKQFLKEVSKIYGIIKNKELIKELEENTDSSKIAEIVKKFSWARHDCLAIPGQVVLIAKRDFHSLFYWLAGSGF